jgi:3-hydroxyacyl-CoA dehydrogenase/enoyl-CoA hydratase/3-hydroxybutyryl-CoA epimerase
MSRARTAESSIRYEMDADGIATLTLDDPGSSANTLDARFAASLADVIDRLYDDKERLAGVVITSAKKTFFAGGDLGAMLRVTPADASRIFAELERIKSDLRRLETIGVPVVAALGGSALGAGLEIALACHHRIALDDGSSEIGFPEVTLGLLPGAGGVTRSVRMFGLADALMNVLLQGQRRKPAKALEVGLVDELVDEPSELVPRARQWALDHRADAEASTQPWDRSDYRIPGGTPSTPKLAAILPAFPATLRRQLKGAPYPAPRAIMSAAVEGTQVDFETASRIESRYFTQLVTGPIAKNMIQAFFFDLQAVNRGAGRPAGVERFTARRVAVLGAGMMGAGIAHACAKVGIDVVLKDVDLAAAERGKTHAEEASAKSVQRGTLTEQQRMQLLDRIKPTADPGDLAGCDVVIEAVFEDVALKHRVLAEAGDAVESDALLCSNTSTLPISQLAEGVGRGADFIGLHFFSPVERMQLVEIIVGEQTSEETLARAYDVARQLKKTPIIVNDSRGFFTSRVFGSLVMEGAAMLAEGVDPMTIERAATQVGFPSGPLALLDEVTLTLPQKIRDAARDSGTSAGAGAFHDHPGMTVIDAMVGELGRRGKAAGSGFYDYPSHGEKSLWPGLRDHFSTNAGQLSDTDFRELQDRYTFIMSLETVRCLGEGVLRSTAEANIGSIFGIGFPAMYGGALQHVNGYAGGPRGFLHRATELAAKHGGRFAPPPLLVEHAEAGKPF